MSDVSSSQENNPFLLDQETIQQWSLDFHTLCQEQMEKGKEYETEGEVPGWLQNDLFRYMYEEMADLSNYSQLMFMRIRFAQEIYLARGIDQSFQSDEEDPSDGVPPGARTFVGRADVPGFFPGTGGFQDS